MEDQPDAIQLAQWRREDLEQAGLTEPDTSDPEKMLAAVKRDGMLLHLASDFLKCDPQIVLAAVRKNGVALQFASQELCEDREIVFAAVRNDIYAIYWCPSSDLVLEMVTGAKPVYGKRRGVWALEALDRELPDEFERRYLGQYYVHLLGEDIKEFVYNELLLLPPVIVLNVRDITVIFPDSVFRVACLTPGGEMIEVDIHQQIDPANGNGIVLTTQALRQPVAAALKRAAVTLQFVLPSGQLCTPDSEGTLM